MFLNGVAMVLVVIVLLLLGLIGMSVGQHRDEKGRGDIQWGVRKGSGKGDYGDADVKEDDDFEPAGEGAVKRKLGKKRDVDEDCSLDVKDACSVQ